MSNIQFPTDPNLTITVSKPSKALNAVSESNAVSNDVEKKQSSKDQQQNKKQKALTDNEKLTEDNTEAEAITAKPHKKLAPPSERIHRGLDRRQKNRRQKAQSVLLNTRSKQDRRKAPGQRPEDFTELKHNFGVDIKA